MKLKNLLSERVLNLFVNDKAEREMYAEEVYEMLQTAYKDIGGIKGTGLDSPADMVKNIPMWKLVRRGGKISAVVLYKDKGGRKSVAVATNGMNQGRKDLAMIFRDEIKMNRSYSEKSGKALAFLAKVLPDDVGLEDVSMTYDEAEKIIGDEVRRPPSDDVELERHPTVADRFYQRLLGDTWKTKLMVGSIGHTIR